MIVIQKQSGANSENIAKKVHGELPEIRASLSSEVELGIILDTSANITNTIRSLEETIMITFIVVVLVVFIFQCSQNHNYSFHHFMEHLHF